MSTSAAPHPLPVPSPVSPPAVVARGVSRAYGDRTALDRVDLRIEQGEIVALLGPNGAGKTTLVEILEGYRRRDGGTVAVLGEDPATAGLDWRARIGIVLQEVGDHLSLTVGEVLWHFAGYFPAPRDPAAVLDAVGLSDRRATRVAQLSGGLRRRLDVALGIIGDPELLFLDEPTTGFDPEARREFWTLIRRLNAGGTTILLTTHYLDEAEALADRVAVISRGRLLDVAPPDELGGRRDAAATVRWREGPLVRELRTADPARVVAELATRFEGPVPDLSVAHPTLEQIYLQMIGEPV